MKININLATRPFTDLGPVLKRLRMSMAVFALVSIGLGYGLHRLHSKAEAARARERGVDTEVTKISRERQGYVVMMRQPDNAQVVDQAHNLNTLFDQKAFSWTLAMEDLEAVLPGGVQVTTLEPDRDEKTAIISLKLRVVGPRDKAVELVEKLEHSRHFLRPAIVGESTENSGGPGQPLEAPSMSNKVNVDLTAEYNPATLSEVPPVKKEAEKDQADGKTAPVAAAPAPKHVAAAVGPGLRRPPLAGVSRPPAYQPTPPMPGSPEARREARQHRYPGLPKLPPDPNTQPSPRPRPAGPGGPQ